MESIAERRLVCEDRRGPIDVCIRISRPRQVSPVLWSCDVAMEGLFHDTVKVKGVDSFQAMCLSLGLVRDTLDSFLSKGGKLYWADRSGPMDLDQLFS